MPRLLRTLLAYWLQWWWLDLLISMVVAGGCWLATTPGTGVDLLGKLALDDRRGVYTDMLQLATIFGAFGGVAFAVYLSRDNERTKQVWQAAGRGLLRVWLAALVSPWISAVALVMARVVDRGGVGSSNGARWIAVGSVILVILQLIRITWVFYNLTLIMMDSNSSQRSTSPRRAQVIRRHAGPPGS